MPIHDDDAPAAPLNMIEAAKDLREKLDDFATFVGRELVEIVVLNNNYLESCRQAGHTAPPSSVVDPLIYVICHRLLTTGIPFGDRVMAKIADSLNIGALEN